MSGLFHAQCGSDDAIMAFLDAADDCPVCRAFFMHDFLPLAKRF